MKMVDNILMEQEDKTGEEELGIKSKEAEVMDKPAESGSTDIEAAIMREVELLEEEEDKGGENGKTVAEEKIQKVAGDDGAEKMDEDSPKEEEPANAAVNGAVSTEGKNEEKEAPAENGQDAPERAVKDCGEAFQVREKEQEEQQADFGLVEEVTPEQNKPAEAAEAVNVTKEVSTGETLNGEPASSSEDVPMEEDKKEDEPVAPSEPESLLVVRSLVEHLAANFPLSGGGSSRRASIRRSVEESEDCCSSSGAEADVSATESGRSSPANSVASTAANRGPDFNKALQELADIEQASRRAWEEPVAAAKQKDKTPKRPAVGEAEVAAAKKAKLDEEASPSSASKNEEGDKKKAKRLVKRLTRKELEDMVCDSLATALSARSEVARLRRRCDAYEESVEKFRRKAQALRKQNQDLTQVFKRYVSDCRESASGRNGGRPAVPLKITRSVGLTVNITSTTVVAERRPAATPSPKGVSLGARPVPVRGIQPAQRTSPQQQQMVRTIAAPPQPGAAAVRINGNVVNGSPYTSRRPMSLQPVTRQEVQQQVQARAVAAAAAAAAAAGGGAGTMPAPLPHTTITRITRPGPASKVAQATNNVPAAPTAAARGGGNPEVVDLADDDDASARQPNRTVVVANGVRPANLPSSTTYRIVNAPAQQQQPNAAPRIVIRAPQRAAQQPRPVHPAPLPEFPRAQQPHSPHWKLGPPKSQLKISKLKNGIVLSWNMPHSAQTHAPLATFQIYAYQESSTNAHAVTSALWKKVGDVKALPLPMACTLTQFQSGHRYHFAVRAQDQHSRVGPFSDPQTISLV